MVLKTPEVHKSKQKQESKEEIDLSLLEESIPSVEVEDIFENGNMLDSLREQLKQEDEKQKVNGEDAKERSSSEFNMPFEVNPRDSQNTGLRSSGLINVSTRQQKEKFGKPKGKNVIIDDGSLEEYKGV